MEVLITVPKGKLLLERNIRHTSHGKCMGDVRAGNSHHQVVIQTSRQQSKYATGLLCIILKFSMCTPWTPPQPVSGGHAEKHWISFLRALPFAVWLFLFIRFNPLHATLLVSPWSCFAVLLLPSVQLFLPSLPSTLFLFLLSFFFFGHPNISVKLSSIAQSHKII